MNTPISDTFRQQLQAMRADVLAQLRAQRREERNGPLRFVFRGF